MKDNKIEQAAKKVPLFLIPFMLLWGAARVFAYGAKKYLPGNWHQATLDDGAGERYLSAAARHMTAMQQSNGLVTYESLTSLDEESGLPHIDHAIASLLMLRGIMMKAGFKADPGIGKEPPTKPNIAESIYVPPLCEPGLPKAPKVDKYYMLDDGTICFAVPGNGSRTPDKGVPAIRERRSFMWNGQWPKSRKAFSSPGGNWGASYDLYLVALE